MSKRKVAMAALDAALRALNETDELEAENATAKRDLEATKAEHEQEKSRFASMKAAVLKAETDHRRWREVTDQQRVQDNAAIDRLGAELEALTGKVKAARAEHDNILAGIVALRERLRV